jgi:hypothetical protein
VASLKGGVEEEAKRVDLPLPLGSCKAVALEDRVGWETSVGWFALSEILLPASSTWKSCRQSPLGHVGPTMGGPALDRCCMVESRKAGTDVGNEGEELE